jgi:hypothetical protein
MSNVYPKDTGIDGVVLWISSGTSAGVSPRMEQFTVKNRKSSIPQPNKLVKGVRKCLKTATLNKYSGQ